MDTTLYSLICEGRCNPNLAIVDQAANAYAKQFAQDGPLTRANEDIASLQRTLVHTPHLVVEDMARCLDCGTRRRYGRTL